jgi:hypothetical protein
MMKEDRVGRLTWLWGAILVFAGCASSSEVVMRSLPLAGDVRPSSPFHEVSLREAGVSGRSDRIFLTRVSLKNPAEKTLHFGPEDVYLADAGGRLLYRISEQWLPKYYNTRRYGQPDVADHKAIPAFPAAKVKLGDAMYAAPPSTRAQRDKVATDVAELVEDTFVRPQEDAPGTFMDKTPDVVFGALLKAGSLGPGDGVSGYVYFYRAAAQEAVYPLRVVIKLESGVHTFLFRE